MLELIARFDAEHIWHACGRDAARITAPDRPAHPAALRRSLKVADVPSRHRCLHRKISKRGRPYAANRVSAICSKMFSLAIRWGMRDDNPARGVERNDEAKRKRYLRPDELRA